MGNVLMALFNGTSLQYQYNKVAQSYWMFLWLSEAQMVSEVFSKCFSIHCNGTKGMKKKKDKRMTGGIADIVTRALHRIRQTDQIFYYKRNTYPL